jgi:uncharacterized tellurite resistance protein B-like protein
MGTNNQLESHFLNLYSVALSDSTVDTEELQLLYQLGDSYGIDNDDIDEIIENPHRVRIKIPDNVYEKINQLYDLARMILADDKIDLRETKTFNKLCVKYGFQEENAPELAEFLLEEAKKETPKEDIFDIVESNLKN